MGVNIPLPLDIDDDKDQLHVWPLLQDISLVPFVLTSCRIHLDVVVSFVFVVVRDSQIREGMKQFGQFAFS